MIATFPGYFAYILTFHGNSLLKYLSSISQKIDLDLFKQIDTRDKTHLISRLSALKVKANFAGKIRQIFKEAIA